MKRGIIIGATSGIGKEVTIQLLKKGWTLGIAGRRAELLKEVESMFPQQVFTATLDVTHPEAVEILQRMADQLQGVDLYFHASGIGKQNVDLELETEENTAQTNVVGFTRMVDAAFQLMKKQGYGHIAVISSIAGTKGLGPAPSYSASKAYQNTYIQALEQLADNQHLSIRFTDIRPGFVDTPLLNSDTYPMLLSIEPVAKEIVRAIESRKHIRIIDWRYRLLVFFWRLIPNIIWRKLPLVKRK
ncbi:MAG: SDR family NAD(P)-dependent oxidoreductase [Prevotellaceae bacterium]|nr:SDR family NAD(P)-dependent oxidoreductase [Prevotellaceae bacterium]MDY3365725.1 SDR family NAD(P)-dependent oxidoreductase [Prevotella sp.]